MSRDNLRQHLPGANNRRDALANAPIVRKAPNCELRGCVCKGQGKPEIVIPCDGTERYACQIGYERHLSQRGLNQMATWKPTGAQLTTVQPTLGEERSMRHVHDIVSDFDRYAESRMAEETDDDH